MTTRRRYDRTIRTVMWLDAFLSLAMVVAAIIAVPIVASIGVPHAIVRSVGIASIVCGVLLAAFGAITAVVLMLRMRDGDFLLPRELRLPLPGPMRPAGVLAASVRRQSERPPTQRAHSTLERHEVPLP
jgi:hypothetical protein